MAIRHKSTGVIVLAIRKATGEMLFNPASGGEDVSGDHLIAMGRREESAETGEMSDGSPRMTVLTAEQTREVDRLTIEENGVPSLALMENAAHRVDGRRWSRSSIL